jgi:hypothetical protein
VVRPFIKSDMMNRVFFHSSGMNMEKFYKNHVPKSSLPSDLGGDLESVAILHEKQCKELQKMQDWFDFEGKFMRYELEDADVDGHNDYDTGS